MNKEIEKVFTERGFTNIEQMATMFDYYKQEIEKLQNKLEAERKITQMFINELSNITEIALILLNKGDKHD